MDTEILAKYTLKDSVFTDLFGIPEYTLALYRALHPEDTTATEEDIAIVTLENIFLNQPYNDLGFTVKDRLLILVEAQSTWTMNILVRVLLYASQTIQKYIDERELDIYGSKKIELYRPEFYVLYLGDRKEKPEILSLNEAFFPNQPCDLEVKVRMLYDGMQGDIINQYVTFTKVYTDQLKLHGRTKKAVTETIRICKDRDVLRQYLLSREKEVIDIMTTLFDQKRILEIHLKNQFREWEEKGLEEGRAEGRAEGMEKGRAEGRAEGMEKGRAEGMEKGRAEGMEKGRAEGKEAGRAEGKAEGRLSAFRDIREKLAQSGMSPAMIDSVLAGL